MAWVSTALRGDDRAAWGDALGALRDELGAPPDLCCVFVAGEPALSDLGMEVVRDTLRPHHVVGCAATGVLGNGREVEAGPALGLVAGHLEGAALRTHYVPSDALREGALPGVGAAASALILADPFSCDGELLIAELGRAAGDRPVVGGLASGAPGAGGAAIFADGDVKRGGCAMLEVEGGGWTLDTVVAQGCRPMGPPFFVTAVEDRWLRELDGKPPMEVLRELARNASEKDRALMQHALFLGIEMHAQRSSYGHGDFLVRNLVGANQELGALAVAGHIQVGQVVQFQVRDAEAAAEDLHTRLDAYSAGTSGDPSAALLFSCIGRGEQLYGEPDHDSHDFLRRVGGVPLGGFFCNGEIGPVGGQTFLHAYTSAFGMFRRVGGA